MAEPPPPPPSPLSPLEQSAESGTQLSWSAMARSKELHVLFVPGADLFFQSGLAAAAVAVAVVVPKAHKPKSQRV